MSHSPPPPPPYLSGAPPPPEQPKSTASVALGAAGEAIADEAKDAAVGTVTDALGDVAVRDLLGATPRAAADTAAAAGDAMRALLNGDLSANALMVPLQLVYRIFAHTLVRATAGTVQGDELKEALTQELTQVNEKLDHLMHAQHRARGRELLELTMRVPIIMDKLRNGERDVANRDLKQLKENADDLYQKVNDAYSALPPGAVEERIDSTRIACVAIALRSWKNIVNGEEPDARDLTAPQHAIQELLKEERLQDLIRKQLSGGSRIRSGRERKRLLRKLLLVVNAVNRFLSAQSAPLVEELHLGGSRGGVAQLEELASSLAQCVATLEGHGAGVIALACSPDGGKLFSGSWDDTVKVWALEEGGEGGGRCVATLEGHGDGVYALACSPDGGTVFVGSFDSKKIKVWTVHQV